MKITIQGNVVQNMVTEYKDKDGQAQLKRVLIFNPIGTSEVIKISVPYESKFPTSGEVILTDVEMNKYDFTDEKGKRHWGNSFKVLGEGVKSKKSNQTTL